MVAKRTKPIGRRIRVAGRGSVGGDRERTGRTRGLASPGSRGPATERRAGESTSHPVTEPDADAAADPAEPDAEEQAPEKPEADSAETGDETPQAEGGDTDEAEPEAETDETDDEPAARRVLAGLRTRTLVLIVVLSAVLGIGLTYWFHSESEALRSAAAGNEAVVNPTRTNEVATQISGKLEKLWSYDYRRLDQQQSEVRGVATKSFLDQYAQQFQRIKQLAPAQQAVVQARVVDIAVQRLAGDNAELIVFLNQAAAKGASQDVTRAAARLHVSATLVDGSWRVSGVTPF